MFKFIKVKWLRTTLIVFSCVLVIALCASLFLILEANHSLTRIQENAISIDKKASVAKAHKGKVINILLLGVDERKHDRGRSDTLIVLSLHPKTDTMKMISIPRDTRVDIVGHNTTDKINHAYAFGGVDMSVNTVETFLNIDIDYFVKVNMEGLAAFVDAVGGVKVDNSLDWYDEGYYKKGYHYHSGALRMNGSQALGYVRMRHLDPNGDFGRNARQRQVIQAVIDKSAKKVTIKKVRGLLKALDQNVKTNIDVSAMKLLSKNYKDTRRNILQYEVKGVGTKIEGIYYLQVTEQETSDVHNLIVKE
jgi:LCP family protein required for cell wall assembly